MKKNCALVAVLSILVSLGSALTEADFPTFADYVKTYNKTYDATELAKREIQYASKISELIKITDYTPEVNEYSDWYPAEIAVLKGYKSLESGSRNGDEKPQTSSAPASVDWSKTSVTTPKNQGRCGSCWAFAAVAYSESKLIIDGREDRSVDLSEQRLLECTQDSSCNGGYLQYAFESVLKGIPSQFLFPYSPQDSSSFICDAPGTTIGKIDQNYYDLSTSQLEQLVAERPIAISVSADNWENYGSGVFKCGVNDPINHAVLLVGYTSDYWLIKNSWGTNWGDGGYIKVTKQVLRNCGIGTSAHRTFETFSNVIFTFLLLLSVIIL